MNREKSFNMLRTGVAMLAAILVAFIIILFISDQPAESIRIFLLEPLSSKRYLGNIVETMTPLVFSGLAMAVLCAVISDIAGVPNIALEGLMLMAAFAGMYFSFLFQSAAVGAA